MPSVPPPQGLTESDYESIEAAVTETVRGRWFLSEFARRNRMAEMGQLLEAIGRLEANVAASQTALPSADPSVRLLIQRIKEISVHLDGLANEMRDAGIDERFAQAVIMQARAVSGMMRGGPAPKPLPAAKPAVEPGRPRMPPAGLPPQLAGSPPRIGAEPSPAPDARLAALSGLDGLTLAEKLALFS